MQELGIKYEGEIKDKEYLNAQIRDHQDKLRSSIGENDRLTH